MVVVIGFLIAVAALGGGFLLVTEAGHALHFVMAVSVLAAFLTIVDGAYNAAQASTSGNFNTHAQPEVRPEHGDDFWGSVGAIWAPALGGWLDVLVVGGGLAGVAAGAAVKYTEGRDAQ